MKKICFIFALLISFQIFADDDEKLKLAIMDFEDLSGKISKNTLIEASEYFRVIFAQTNRYIIISKDRQKNQISDLRKKYNTDPSYKSCTDKNCQIQLGQALSADMIVKTSVSYFAGFFTLASELIDLEKEATIIAATEEYDGSPKELRTAIKNIVAKIVETEKTEKTEKTENNKTTTSHETLQNMKEESHRMSAQERRTEEEYDRKRRGSLEWSSSYREKATYNEAKQYCENLNENGHNDWRLPTIDEWRSTFQNCPETQLGGECQISEINNKLDNDAFSKACRDGCRKGYSTQTGKGWFWSSSGRLGTNHYWVINLKPPRISSLNNSNNSRGSVKCVR